MKKPKKSSRKKLARRPKVQNFERVDNIEKVINTISQIFIKLKMLKKNVEMVSPLTFVPTRVASSTLLAC